MRLEWLRHKTALQDYQIGLRDRDRWVDLGDHFCPGFLLDEHRAAVCEVYGVGLVGKPDDAELPDEIRHMNEHYFCTRYCGRSTGPKGQNFWTSDTLSGWDLPVLWRVSGKTLIDIYDGMLAPDGKTRLVDYWLNHPGKREYERIIIVPGSQHESDR